MCECKEEKKMLNVKLENVSPHDHSILLHTIFSHFCKNFAPFATYLQSLKYIVKGYIRKTSKTKKMLYTNKNIRAEMEKCNNATQTGAGNEFLFSYLQSWSSLFPRLAYFFVRFLLEKCKNIHLTSMHRVRAHTKNKFKIPFHIKMKKHSEGPHLSCLA